MKVLMLGWELPPHNSGGLGVACFNLARALARQGTEIDFVLPYRAEHPGAEFMRIIPATGLDPIYRYGGGAYESLRLLEKIIPLGAEHLVSIRDIQEVYCDFIKNSLRTSDAEIVHAHDWLTYEAGMIAKDKFHIPLIAHVHATEFDRAGMHDGNPIIHEIEYNGLMQADRIIAVSRATKHLIHDKYAIPLDKIEVVYNSLDENYYNNYTYNDSAYNYVKRLKAEGYTIVSTVGRFTVQKGLPGLMRAARLAIAKNPKLAFIFAGDGEDRDKLIEMSADFGIAKNIIFTGFVRGRKLRDIYSLSDIFVMSSVSEPFGLTALEAAHHGDVLILTYQSGVSEIIWSALKYDYWDERKLADEIVAVSTHSSLADTLRENVSHEYAQISWNKVAKKCLNIYNSTKHKRK